MMWRSQSHRNGEGLDLEGSAVRSEIVGGMVSEKTISEDFMVKYDQPTEQLRDDVEVQSDQSD